MTSRGSFLYAETLLNIRQVTVSAALDPPSNGTTTLKLWPDRKTIGLSHEGSYTSVKLPAKVVQPRHSKPSLEIAMSPTFLPIPSSPSHEISFRLPIDTEDHLLHAPTADRMENIIPWSAASLPLSVQFHCCDCMSPLLSRGSITAWKDLPNDNWAEMMEFWHCHKPTGHHYENQESAGKGYAAANRLTAKVAVGFVDLCYILLHQHDVTGVNTAPGPTDSAGLQTTKLLCKACNASVGEYDVQTEGYRLYKWSLALLGSHPATPIAFPLQFFISAQLLSLIDNQAVRKFVITSDELGHLSGLDLWVFNPDIYYTSTTIHEPQRAMKVFSKPIFKPREYLETRSTSHEEVNLPHEIFVRLRNILNSANLVGLKSPKTFEGWDAGLLERFDGGECRNALNTGQESGIPLM